MRKLTEDQRKEILLSYKLDNSKANISKLCKDYNITQRRLFQIAKEDKNKELSVLEDTSTFTKRANAIIEQAFDRLEDRLKDDDKATISQLATLIGILYDKSRLENNLSTNNSSININIKVEK